MFIVEKLKQVQFWCEASATVPGSWWLVALSPWISNLINCSISPAVIWFPQLILTSSWGVGDCRSTIVTLHAKRGLVDFNKNCEFFSWSWCMNLSFHSVNFKFHFMWEFFTLGVKLIMLQKISEDFHTVICKLSCHEIKSEPVFFCLFSLPSHSYLAHVAGLSCKKINKLLGVRLTITAIPKIGVLYTHWIHMCHHGVYM